MRDANCIFCKIIKGDIPSYTIYENEYVNIEFVDLNYYLEKVKDKE